MMEDHSMVENFVYILEKSMNISHIIVDFISK